MLSTPPPALSTPPPADVSTFLAFPSPEKLLRLGPKSSVLIAQQVRDSAASCGFWSRRKTGTSRARALGGDAASGNGGCPVFVCVLVSGAEFSDSSVALNTLCSRSQVSSLMPAPPPGTPSPPPPDSDSPQFVPGR